jgi:hypothetical protein
MGYSTAEAAKDRREAAANAAALDNAGCDTLGLQCDFVAVSPTRVGNWREGELGTTLTWE